MFENEAGSNKFKIFPQKWIKETNTIGIVSKKFIYTEEASVLNVALFGMTAKEYKKITNNSNNKVTEDIRNLNLQKKKRIFLSNK